MSLPAVSQSQTDNRLGDAPGRSLNGGGSNGPASTPIDPLDFGLFNDEVREELQRLQGNISGADNSVTALSKTFMKYGKIVRTVGERYGNDQILEEKVKELEAANSRIWRDMQVQEGSHQKHISQLKRGHEEQLSALRKQADAGQQEKKRFEEMEQRLEDQHEKTKRRMAIDLKQKMSQLEIDNAGKIATLQKDKTALESANSKLEHELEERILESDHERELYEAMQNRARTDLKKLEQALADIKGKYEMDLRPSHFYVEQFNGLFGRVGQIVSSSFTELPKNATNDPVKTSERLAKQEDSRFSQVPIADSEYSRVLRLANVQHVIVKAIFGSVWKPFFSVHLRKQKRDNSAFPEIHQCLSTHGDEVQRHWKISTLKALDQLDAAEDVGDCTEEMIDQKIVAPLEPLLDNNKVDRFVTDLRTIFRAATELGKMARNDQSPVYLDTSPFVSDRDGWKEYWTEPDEITDTINQSPTSPTTHVRLEPLFVSPKIYRHRGMTGQTATATTNIAAGVGEAEVEIIRPGSALFPATGIFQLGALDWQKIRDAGKEAAKNINGLTRRQSRSISVTGSGTVPTSPIAPSKKWPREGIPDRD
ncbi:hypothetical protein LTR92_005743 [Exophiala xenobiotica]|nr:hypothetical protein LTR92_005743 [Exophiala xenobiotica]KAK5438755.1 hypothetical protein LTR18_008733 [Exophiala xenobiotica]